MSDLAESQRAVPLTGADCMLRAFLFASSTMMRARSVASAMIEHCIERGLEPCWDAHNPISTALATKLGFVDPQPYTAYEVRT